MQPPRTLVFCSAGARVGQLPWLEGLSAQPQMDAAIAYYGAQPLDQPPPVKYFVAQRDFKIPNFLQLLREHESALDHDLFMFIDDDIVATAQDLARWRQIIVAEGLDISQPALTQSSKADWPHTRFRSGAGTDREQFVEVQCFALTRRALRAALPYFFMVKTGYGLDLVLYRLASTGRLSSAVAHDVQVMHPYRPEEQTVRSQMPDFDDFRQKMMRLINFCFEDGDVFPDLVVASHLLGDTRPATVRWVRSTRYIAGRLARRFKRAAGMNL